MDGLSPPREPLISPRQSIEGLHRSEGNVRRLQLSYQDHGECGGAPPKLPIQVSVCVGEGMVFAVYRVD
jgi:hypothetical protein